MAKNSLVNCMHHVSPRRLFAGKSAWYPSEGMPRASFTAGVWRFYTVREGRILPMPRGSSSQNPRNLNFGKSRDLSRGVVTSGDDWPRISVPNFFVAPADGAIENQLISATLGLVAAERSATCVARQRWQQARQDLLNYRVNLAVSFVSEVPPRYRLSLRGD